ncbi:MAG: MarR family transcriptional regulator [Pyrinomonadaceae bacterium]|nr:MarR family transcriptional regulator [Pyrinomonadaceae bacterium]
MTGKLQTELKQSKPFATREEEVYLNIQRTAEALLWKATELLKPYDLTPTQYNVLRILRGAEREGLICREIGERMVSRDPDVTKMLDRLEKRGLTVRERDHKDRRVIITRVTDEGLKLLKELDPYVAGNTRELLGHLGTRRLETLNELLEEAREKAL